MKRFVLKAGRALACKPLWASLKDIAVQGRLTPKVTNKNSGDKKTTLKTASKLKIEKSKKNLN
jgi:hypothetical protein